MNLRPRRKSIRDLTSGKTLVNRAAKRLEVPALEMIQDKVYNEGLEKKYVSLVGPKVKSSTISSCAEPINSEHNEWLEPESVRVNKVAVL